MKLNEIYQIIKREIMQTKDNQILKCNQLLKDFFINLINLDLKVVNME